MSAVVSYQSFFSDNQLMLATDQLENALRYARMSALTMNTTILFCARGKNAKCGLHWNRGQLIVRQDTNAVLRYFPVISSRYDMRWRGSLGDPGELAWESTGFTHGEQGSFFLCADDPAALSAQIIVLRTGRLRSVAGHFSGCKR